MKKRTTIIAAVFAATALSAGMAHAISGTNPLPRTGQGEAGKCYDTGTSPATEIPCTGTKQDGETRKGVAWPGTRFTDNSNGTVTDNLTGLIWLKDITCLGMRDWDTANALAVSMQNASCGLTDGSTAGMWRLPNIQELKSLVDINYANPALTAGHPFIIPGGNYSQSFLWSSTAYAINNGYFSAVRLSDGVAVGPGFETQGGDDYGYHYTYYSGAAGNFVLPVKIMP